MISIELEPDTEIEPGHQWLMVKDSPSGRALATLLCGNLPDVVPGANLIFPHDHVVDQNIVDLINTLAHVRFQSPTLVQLTMPSPPSSEKAGRRHVNGFVYLIRAENGKHKIGKTINLGKRFKPFSVHFPMKWELIHSFRSQDYTGAEAKLHRRFADKRDEGEWFRLTDDDVDYIKNLQDLALDEE